MFIFVPDLCLRLCPKKKTTKHFFFFCDSVNQSQNYHRRFIVVLFRRQTSLRWSFKRGACTCAPKEVFSFELLSWRKLNSPDVILASWFSRKFITFISTGLCETKVYSMARGCLKIVFISRLCFLFLENAHPHFLCEASRPKRTSQKAAHTLVGWHNSLWTHHCSFCFSFLSLFALWKQPSVHNATQHARSRDGITCADSSRSKVPSRLLHAVKQFSGKLKLQRPQLKKS